MFRFHARQCHIQFVWCKFLALVLVANHSSFIVAPAHFLVPGCVAVSCSARQLAADVQPTVGLPFNTNWSIVCTLQTDGLQKVLVTSIVASCLCFILFGVKLVIAKSLSSWTILTDGKEIACTIFINISFLTPCAARQTLCRLLNGLVWWAHLIAYCTCYYL